jgi:hypothetical protein
MHGRQQGYSRKITVDVKSPHMGQYDLVLQELHQRRTELLQLMDEFEAGPQEDQSLAEAWRDELSRVEREIIEFEERNKHQQPPLPMGGLGTAPEGT